MRITTALLSWKEKTFFFFWKVHRAWEETFAVNQASRRFLLACIASGGTIEELCWDEGCMEKICVSEHKLRVLVRKVETALGREPIPWVDHEPHLEGLMRRGYIDFQMIDRRHRDAPSRYFVTGTGYSHYVNLQNRNPYYRDLASRIYLLCNPDD